METISRQASSLALLVVLLFSFFIMMSYQVNRADTISTVEGTIQFVVSPVHRLSSSLWLGISGTWTNYVGLIGRASEADALRERIGVLQRRNQAFVETARENARLKQLLNLQARLELPSIAAQTIGRDMAHGYEAFTVNRGARDGVRANSAVVTRSGNVVGRIVYVGPYTSRVQLITDSESAVGAKVLRTSAHGVVHGAGSAIMEFGYVTSLADVEEGDLVVTSGDDGIYPPGLEIGRVIRVVYGAPVPGSPRLPRVARDETALFLDIELEALADVRRIDQVLLIEPRLDGE